MNIEQIRNAVPPTKRCGYKVNKWKIGITLAPRRQSTIDHCLRSLIDAGFSLDDVIVFAEPGSKLPKFDVQIEQRTEKHGAWPNTYAAMVQMSKHLRHCDAIMMMQDDAIFVSGDVRQYLEAHLWPHKRAIASVYTARHYLQDEPGWHEVKKGFKFWGSLAMIYSKSSFRRIMSAPCMIEHLLTGKGGGLKNVDSVIGLAARQKRCPIYCTTPSFVEHIGVTSTLYPNAKANGNRRAGKVVKV